jgi:hypothetical protein
MGNIMGSLSGMAAEPQLPNMNDIMSNMNDPSALLGKAPDLYSKCGFTTMELEMKNNPIYTHHNNSFLPKKFTLEDDNTISQGIEKRMTKYI